MAVALADKLLGACANPLKGIATMTDDEAEIRRVASLLRTDLIQSRRFFIDDEVTIAATEFGIEHLDILYEMLSRARAPFPKTWIEYSVHAQVTAAGLPVADDAPERVGCFIEQLHPELPVYRMTHVGQDVNSKKFAPNYFSEYYDLSGHIAKNTAVEDQIFSNMMKTTKMPNSKGAVTKATAIAAVLVGAAYKQGNMIYTTTDEGGPEWSDFKLIDKLVDHVTYNFSPYGRSMREALEGHPMMEKATKIIKSESYGIEAERRLRETKEKTIRFAERGITFGLAEHMGAWRFIIGLLTLINARDYVTSDSTFKTGKNHIANGKVVSYLEHRRVSLKLPRKVVVARLKSELHEAARKRRHEVIGHWAHSHKTGNPDCHHVYVAETPLREVCEKCKHKRWWVKPHERGDASLGYITKDRVVELDR